MITVNRCGYDSRHMLVLNTCIPAGYEDYTLLLVKTNAFFEQNGILIDTPPGTVILYDRHVPIRYGCREPHYNDDWIHFELHGDDADLLQRLSLPLSTPFVLPFMGSLTDYCRLVVTEKFSSHLYREDTLDALMHTLLYTLASLYHGVRDVNSRNKYYYPLSRLRMEILNAPDKNGMWTTWQARFPSAHPTFSISINFFRCHLHPGYHCRPDQAGKILPADHGNVRSFPCRLLRL